MISNADIFSFPINPQYDKLVAYFSMEFAVDQALKTYSGGLGFLAGSHLRSAYELKQHLFGVGILWKYGYYDQGRNEEGLMKPYFITKDYSFLTDTGILFAIQIHNSPVFIKAYLLKSETFSSAPLFLLSTDIPENDEISRTITHVLYDSTISTRIAQSIVLGIGGATLIDKIGLNPKIYHMNEGHSLPLNFYLYSKFQSLAEVKKRVVFTTHTPESAGNEEHSFELLKEMSFFYHLQIHEVKFILGLDGENLNYTLAALKFANKANGVSKLHGIVANEMWQNYTGICPIYSITNAQNKTYWKDDILEKGFNSGDDRLIADQKKNLKKLLFLTVADQCGKIFNPNVLTLIWARRFAGYKRADLLLQNWDRFLKLIENSKYPIQIIWAGKPYPEDHSSIQIFNEIIKKTLAFPNCAVLVGYELALSSELKKGSDIWLNNPRMYREASGTSGMAAAMNGSINVSIPDGWVPEFAIDGQNSFVIQAAPENLSQEEKDNVETINLLDTLEQKVIPLYYENQLEWIKIMKKAAQDIFPKFDSGRMVEEYYHKLYS